MFNKSGNRPHLANGDIKTKCNPAHDASRGITAKELVESSRWITGLEFLWMPKDQWPQLLEDRELVSLPDDPEVKKVTSYATSTQEPWNLVEVTSQIGKGHVEPLLSVYATSRNSSNWCSPRKKGVLRWSNLSKGLP